MRLHQLTFFGFSVLALGCEGGQTGDLSGERPDTGGETGAGSGCEEHKQKLAGFDEETEFGTPEQLMSFAEKGFDAPLTWKERSGQTWHVGPESGASSIHLEVTRGENAYWVTYTPKPNDSGIEIGVSCPGPQLGVDVHVDVSTEGGALAEAYDTLLLAPSAQLATLSVPFDLAKLSGALTVTYDDPRVELLQLGLSATLMAEGMTGSIGGVEQTNLGAAVSGGQALLAVWPDSPACADQYGDSTGIAVASDENALGITGDAAAELLAASTPVQVKWLDGSLSELTLTAAIEGDGCIKLPSYSYLDDSQAGMAKYPARFTLKSEDGYLDGEYLGTLLTTPGQDSSTVSAEAFLELTPDQIVQSGFATVTVPADVERLAVQLQVSVEDGLAQGALHLNGLTDPPCLKTPPMPMPEPGGGASSPGCEGTHVTPLESAAWPL